jgi:nucleotide-binding universal stress UspA family protein
MSEQRDVGGMDLRALEGCVVVGDDASRDSQLAVRWAAEDAARRGVQLVVVRAWLITSAPRPKDVEAGYVPSEEEFADAVREAMASDLAPVLDDLKPSTGVESVPRVLLMPAHCSAEEALVEASRHAAVIVVGARGRGLARWLGSVSGGVVRSAHGPVVVVPGRGERGAA